jgi:CheY-like chemotaxis protein
MREGCETVSRTVLVVDDDPRFRGMLCEALGMHGLKVVAAADATNGLAIAKSCPVDAVLSDYQMPEADGLAFCQALRAAPGENPGVPVWLMTGSTDLSTERARAAGAVDVFRKPFRVTEVIHAMERHLTPAERADEARSA